mmetsp:Transcript_13587/g.25999  ORF Transcript_13587/g.25999 Transcript_13587/m.25999 type:complete len:216 (-) Transcript_13587:366-1013(-)|eukprot:CAMPEP_0201632784 /NCGR_PEP_ID=MMETSP0493-20130528/6303_1 /ASSEMBLY_ACC=CAM_ASM_000838 /TAXON_ID=420259 /ORGANISM="Thalassiosira gravida, Strain GMp14c1" /LENGTH=215 /DNA_ID=CAMNT_0048104371 /DNA_START=115 /DNA_END=762 /DNA_ORIENTATION=-
MVRQKSRWLLVQFDFENDILSSCSLNVTANTTTSKSSQKRKLRTSLSNSSNTLSESSSTIQQQQQVTSTDIYRSLQDTLTQNFGLVGASTSDVQVRLYDPKVRLAIIKTTRDKYPTVRSSLTLLTQIKQGGDVLKVVASTIAVSGSARTARNAAWEEIRKRFYRGGENDGQELGSSSSSLLGKNNGELSMKKSRVAMEKSLLDLEDRLDKIDSGC